jgi:hypothetical protein
MVRRGRTFATCPYRFWYSAAALLVVPAASGRAQYNNVLEEKTAWSRGAEGAKAGFELVAAASRRAR